LQETAQGEKDKNKDIFEFLLDTEKNFINFRRFLTLFKKKEKEKRRDTV